MGLTRRHFIRIGSLSLLAAASSGSGSRRAGAESDATGTREPLLVVIFLRGAADGLHLVPPIGDRSYARLRGELAIEKALPFAVGFGLHPELAPLTPLVERGELAVVHAVGSPDATRSHFEAQDFMEAGAPGSARVSGGWLSRGLASEQLSAFASIAIAPQLPLSLRGAGSFAITNLNSFGIPGLRREAREALAALYAADSEDPVSQAGHRALAAWKDFEAHFGRQRGRGRLGRPGRAGTRIEQSAEELLALERAGLGVEAVFLESSGWDTHVNQGARDGAMANWIGDLARGIASLDAGLRRRRELRLIVMTEFGRTVRPNGSRGTDHGHGSVMLVAGAGVKGGLHGDWRGLSESNLYQGRDLPVTTDWRTPLHEVLAAHLGAKPPKDTFPDFAPQTLGLFG